MYKLKNLIPSVKSLFENSDKANEYTNRPDLVDADDEVKTLNISIG